MSLSIISSVNSNICKYQNSATANRPPSANLLHYYKFITSDITSNINVKNYATSTYNSTLNTSMSNCIVSDSKWSGRSSLWSNGGNYSLVVNSGISSLPSTWTISFWLKVPSTCISTGGDPICLSYGGGNNTTNAFMLELYMNSTTGKLINHIYAYGGGNYILNNVNQSSYPLTSWVHFCICSVSNNCNYYLNGNLIGSSGYNVGGLTFGASSKFYFGGGGNTPDFYFDEIRIYGGIGLSQAQVQALYGYDGSWI
jgi:hypothetical protein